MKKLYELYEEDLRELFKGHENGCAFALRLVGDDCENYGRCYQCPMYDRGSNADLVIDEALEELDGEGAESVGRRREADTKADHGIERF